MEQQEKEMLLIDGGISEQQVESWKAKHHKVMIIEVVDGEEQHVGYFRRPTLEVMSAVSKLGKTDEVKSAEAMFDNCFLGGSHNLRQDAVLFMECTKRLGELFNGCTSSLKNV